MKKIRIMTIAAMALMCAISCSKSEMAEPQTKTGVTSEFSGITEVQSESKAYVERDGGKYLVKWAEGDNVIITDGANTGTFSANSFGTTTTDFSSVSGDIPTSAPFTAYSPADYYNDGTLTIPAEQTCKGANIPVFPIVGRNDGRSIVFESVMSVIKLRIKTINTVTVKTIKLKSGDGELLNGTAAIEFETDAVGGKYAVSDVAFSDGTDELTLNYPDGLQMLGNSETDVLVAIPANDYAAGFKITLIADEEKKETRTCEEGFTLERAKIHGTAEVIPYEFPFCYCYGDANTIVAYDKTSVDIDITPYTVALNVPDVNDFTRLVTYFAPKPASAELVWREEGLTMTDIALNVEENKVTVSGLSGYGNAVVAIKDAEGKILWSYQIWKPEIDPTDASVLKNYEGREIMRRI